MRQSLKIGLFIGVTFASVSALILRFTSVNYWTLVTLLYLYCLVGALTSYFVHKSASKRVIEKIEKRLEKIFTEV